MGKLKQPKGINQSLLCIFLALFVVVVVLLSLYAAIGIAWEIGKPVTPGVLLKRNIEVIFPSVIVIMLLRMIVRAIRDWKRCNEPEITSGQMPDTEQGFTSELKRPCRTFEADLDRICSRCVTAAQKLETLKVHQDLKAQMLSAGAECRVASVLLLADPNRDGRAKAAIQNGEVVLREFESAYSELSVLDQSADIDKSETLLNTFNTAQKRKYAAIMIGFYRKLAVIRRALNASNFSHGEHCDSSVTANAGADYDRLMQDHELEITSFFENLEFGNQ